MMAAPTTPVMNVSAKRRVSFRPFVEVLDIPGVDPETKHLLWYTKCELFIISMNLQRQILIYKVISSLKKERDALGPHVDDLATSHPAKRQRVECPLIDATVTVDQQARSMLPAPAPLVQTAI